MKTSASVKIIFSKMLLTVILVISCLSILSCNQTIKNLNQEKNTNQFTCTYAGRNRSFELYLPKKEDFQDTPLVVMLHGYGNSAQSFRLQTEFEKDALEQNYAVLYISGDVVPTDKTSSSGWNYTYSFWGKVDMSFIVDLSSFVQKQYGLKNSKFVVGFSNGGFMVNKLATEKSDKFDAFVSVGGMMPLEVWNHKKNKAVKYFQINGTKDDVVPMRLNGSAAYNPNPAMEDVIEHYVKSNAIKSSADEILINEKVKILKYGNQVWWMQIKDYHHTWPKDNICKINVNKYILEFLK